MIDFNYNNLSFLIDGTDATEFFSEYLISAQYIDSLNDNVDSLAIQFHDPDNVFNFQTGDIMELTIGSGDEALRTGQMEVDGVQGEFSDLTTLIVRGLNMNSVVNSFLTPISIGRKNVKLHTLFKDILKDSGYSLSIGENVMNPRLKRIMHKNKNRAEIFEEYRTKYGLFYKIVKGTQNTITDRQDEFVITTKADYVDLDPEVIFDQNESIIETLTWNQLSKLDRGVQIKYYDSYLRKLVDESKESRNNQGFINPSSPLNLFQQARYASAADARNAAQAKADSEDGIVVEISTFGNYKYFAGQIVELQNFNDYINRKYIVTEAAHSFSRGASWSCDLKLTNLN